MSDEQKKLLTDSIIKMALDSIFSKDVTPLEAIGACLNTIAFFISAMRGLNKVSVTDKCIKALPILVNYYEETRGGNAVGAEQLARVEALQNSLPRIVLYADKINATACTNCNNVHINLYDQDGFVFASAMVPIEVAVSLSDMIENNIDFITERAHAAPPSSTGKPH